MNFPNLLEISLMELLYLTSGTFLLVSISFLLIVILSRGGKKKLAQIRDGYKAKCDEFVSELLFEEELSDKGKFLEKYFLDNEYRKVFLLQEIIQLHKSLKGELALFLEDYYFSKKLFILSFAKIKSKKKHKIIEGLNELAEMNGKAAIPSVKKLMKRINNPEIQFFFIEFLLKQEPKEGLEALIEYDFYLSDWHQIKILNSLKEQNYIEIPALDKWIIKGGSYLTFGCKLVAQTKAHVEIPVLLSLLSSDSEFEQITAIRTLGALEANEANPFLKEKYHTAPKNIKYEILKAITLIKEESNIVFFSELITSEDSKTSYLSLKALNIFIKANNYLDFPLLFVSSNNSYSKVKLAS